MIYEQNGKNILLIKSSLTSFEGEVQLNNKKDAYKTPEEFIELTKEYFEKNCLIVLNGDTIKYDSIQVQLGHETTLFAELKDVPQKIETFFISFTMFKDMHNNKCELIMTAQGLPQLQHILNNDNQHQILYSVKDGKWVQPKEKTSYLTKPSYLFIGVVVMLVFFSLVVFRLKKKSQSNA